VVVLPTPPFWLAIAMTLPMGGLCVAVSNMTVSFHESK
jgi:hypothetical protein